MKSIAQIIHQNKFPLYIIVDTDKKRFTYHENLHGFWVKRIYDEEGYSVYVENSNGGTRSTLTPVYY